MVCLRGHYFIDLISGVIFAHYIWMMSERYSYLVDVKLFKILCELLTTANLIDRLNGAGPFTVFAPTDGAFGNLPPETLASLKKDPAALAEILNYHVVAGNKSAAALASAFELVTVQGPIIMISVWPVKDGRVMLNNIATITSADIKASNGVIHVIDTVLMPPARRGASSGTRP
jgi:uncharacterized surface protein with fasciclin (FAS1) repeats